MPPKVKITKEDIIKAALDLARENGEATLNARSIAAALGCSTQPIFSNFSSMEELEEEVIKAAYEIYREFLKNEAEGGKYPQYKSFGMAYIRFSCATERAKICLRRLILKSPRKLLCTRTE